MKKARLAILDMYDNTPNQGMRCIQDIVARFARDLDAKLYDVRGRAEVPGMEYDMYLCTGGPGDPREGDGNWDAKFYAWLQAVWTWNLHQERKKKVFFICHSFQMAVLYFNLAEVTSRQSMSFGTFPVHKTVHGVDEELFEGLNNPFWAADFRYYQVVEPDVERFAELGAEILALEKIRPHVPLERAIMAIRFSPDMMGVQFHPEADPQGMIAHFIDEERRRTIMERHGAEKYHRMLADLRNPRRIAHTYDVILPAFLQNAIESCGEEALVG